MYPTADYFPSKFQHTSVSETPRRRNRNHHVNFSDLGRPAPVSTGSGITTPFPASASAPRSTAGLFSVDPPRAARDGYEWVWFPDGYWAERPIRISSSTPMGGTSASTSISASVPITAASSSFFAPGPSSRPLGPSSSYPNVRKRNSTTNRSSGKIWKWRSRSARSADTGTDGSGTAAVAGTHMVRATRSGTGSSMVYGSSEGGGSEFYSPTGGGSAVHSPMRQVYPTTTTVSSSHRVSMASGHATSPYLSEADHVLSLQQGTSTVLEPVPSPGEEELTLMLPPPPPPPLSSVSTQFHHHHHHHQGMTNPASTPTPMSTPTPRRKTPMSPGSWHSRIIRRTPKTSPDSLEQTTNHDHQGNASSDGKATTPRSRKSKTTRKGFRWGTRSKQPSKISTPVTTPPVDDQTQHTLDSVRSYLSALPSLSSLSIKPRQSRDARAGGGGANGGNGNNTTTATATANGGGGGGGGSGSVGGSGGGGGGGTKISRRLFGKAPWTRKESVDSAYTVSSSVREVLRGATPPVTPDVEWVRFRAFPWDQNSFPGGEAVRIKTPPAIERPRGYFESLNPVPTTTAKPTSSSSSYTGLSPPDLGSGSTLATIPPKPTKPESEPKLMSSTSHPRRKSRNPSAATTSTPSPSRTTPTILRSSSLSAIVERSSSAISSPSLAKAAPRAWWDPILDDNRRYSTGSITASLMPATTTTATATGL